MITFRGARGGTSGDTMNPARRRLLQATAAGLVAGAASPLLSGRPPAFGAETEQDKALVVYFSRTGTTRVVAGRIHDLVGGDIVELRPVDPYPADYQAATEQAKREQESNARPPLATDVADLAPYRTLFIGYPIWWGTLPMALLTFLDRHDVAGRTVVPFCTHEGSGLGRSVRDIEARCTRATVRDGLALHGGTGGVATGDAGRERVAQWLRALKIGLVQPG
ncbi:MAG: flavodoxin [Telmatospirillum sp.]|nr:flavodoxin [Telmatospirillum sp.]